MVVGGQRDVGDGSDVAVLLAVLVYRSQVQKTLNPNSTGNGLEGLVAICHQRVRRVVK